MSIWLEINISYLTAIYSVQRMYIKYKLTLDIIFMVIMNINVYP